ncbi:MAG: hypothetical protein U1E65_28410 [Myxococcota bacterium]
MGWSAQRRFAAPRALARVDRLSRTAWLACGLCLGAGCQGGPAGFELAWPSAAKIGSGGPPSAALLAIHGQSGLSLIAIDLTAEAAPPSRFLPEDATQVEILLFEAPLQSLLVRAGRVPITSGPSGNPLPIPELRLSAAVVGGRAQDFAEAAPSAALQATTLDGQGRPRCPSIELGSIPIDAIENPDFLFPVQGGKLFAGAQIDHGYRFFTVAGPGRSATVETSLPDHGLGFRAGHQEPSGRMILLATDGSFWSVNYDDHQHLAPIASARMEGDVRQMIAHQTSAGFLAFGLRYSELMTPSAHSALLRTDSSTTVEVGRFPGDPVDANFLGLLWLPDGSLIAGSGTDGVILHYTPETGASETIPVAGGGYGIAGLGLHPELGVLVGLVDGRMFHRQISAPGEWIQLLPATNAHGVQAFAPWGDGFIWASYTANYGTYRVASGLCTYFDVPDRLGSNARFIVPFDQGWALTGPRNTRSAIINYLEITSPPP